MADNPKSKISDSERTELMKKMDDDLEEHFRMLEEKAKSREEGKRMDGAWDEENWEEEMQNHPFFNTGWKEGKELPPMMKGMQDLKYSPDENSPDELAANYKEDGNFNFKCKKYRFAVASYTEGLKAKGSNRLVNTQLYTNRAASQYHIGNYRSSLRDCEAAVALTPSHIKAIVRGAQCCFGLKKYEDCQTWCDKGLKIEPKHEELNKLRAEAGRIWKQLDRDERKRKAAEKKKKEEESKIMDLIKARGIKVEQRKGGGHLSLEDLEPCHPAAAQKPVHVDPESGELVFPVLFMYPEFGETDFIEEWRENEAVEQHIQVMFGAGAERPPWDINNRYTPSSLVVYLEDESSNLIHIPSNYTLIQAITSKGFKVKAGTPNFIVFVKNSESHVNFLKRHQS